MGQQQLLLLVLGIVIVGLAVVVGIQAFGENQKKANADAMVNDAIRIASDAQAWSLKPTAFGGGNGTLTGVTLTKLGYEVLTTAASTPFTCAVGNYSNLNGCYAMPIGASGTVAITGTNLSTKNQVVTNVVGAKPSDITTTVSSLP